MWMPYSEETSKITTFRSGMTLRAFLMTVDVRFDLPRAGEGEDPNVIVDELLDVHRERDRLVDDTEEVAELVVGRLLPLGQGCSR